MCRGMYTGSVLDLISSDKGGFQFETKDEIAGSERNSTARSYPPPPHKAFPDHADPCSSTYPATDIQDLTPATYYKSS